MPELPTTEFDLAPTVPNWSRAKRKKAALLRERLFEMVAGAHNYLYRTKMTVRAGDGASPVRKPGFEADAKTAIKY